MDIIKCPKCKRNVIINIAEACDEEGETYQCSYCNYFFRYAPDG